LHAGVSVSGIHPFPAHPAALFIPRRPDVAPGDAHCC